MWHRTLIRLFFAMMFVGCGRELLDFPGETSGAAVVDAALDDGAVAVRADTGAADSGEPNGCSEPPCAPPLIITADVDGLSDLVLKGSSLSWHHNVADAPTNSTVNGVPWSLEWPKSTPSCRCDSSPTTISPPLPAREQKVKVKLETGRIPIWDDQPTAKNDYTLTIHFTDLPGGADAYRVRIDYSP